ncbi:MAG: glycosyltransferase family 4 protein [Anaerolineae bacterium]
MRIAFLAETFLPKWDGVTTALCHLLRHLQDRGHTSLMFAPRGAPSHYAGTSIIGLSSYPFPLYPELMLIPPLVDVQEQLAAFRPDLVHLVNPVSLGLAGMHQARGLGVPIVASYHTDIPGYAARYGFGILREPLWTYLRWLHNGADLNLCPSRYTQRELQARGFERVRVWARGVDAEHFSPRRRSLDWRNRLTAGCPDAPLLLYVGRLAPEKRIEWLRPVLAALPEVRLAIVGDGPSRPALEELFAGTRTVFTGYLQGEDLARAYAAADLFAFPSANETFGNVVLEAMASGLPVVAPRSGGPVDHVRDGHNGFLCAPDDPENFVAIVRRLVQDDALRRALGVWARAYATTQSWATILDALLDEYAALIARHPGLGRRWNLPPNLPAQGLLGSGRNSKLTA